MKKLLIILLGVLASVAGLPQVVISTDGSQPDASVLLDVKSSSKGLLPVRMSDVQMNLILLPPAGLLVYNTTYHALYWFNGTIWKKFSEPENLITGNLSSADVYITGGSGAIVGSGVSLTIQKGNLVSGDITIANGAGAVYGTGTSMMIIKSNLVETGSSVLNIVGGTNAVPGNGTTIQVRQAGANQSGFLSSSDWNMLNNKIDNQWIAFNGGIGFTTGRTGIGTSSPALSAVLEMSGTTSGVLLPRMTVSERDGITNPAGGLMIFCTDCGTNGSLCIYTGNNWHTFSVCNCPAPSPGTHQNNSGQITWMWNPASGATGYKWSKTPAYSEATNMGTLTSYTESVTAGNTYYRYIWSYNNCGISEMTLLVHSIP